MTMNQPNIERIQRAVAASLHEHWVLFLVEGIVLVVLGLIAIVVPPIATLAVEILVGWLFLISGILGLIRSASNCRAATASRPRFNSACSLALLKRHILQSPSLADGQRAVDFSQVPTVARDRFES